jgi:ATP-dependent DNA ligase
MKLKKGESREFKIVDYFEGDPENGRVGTLGGVVVQVTPTTTSRVDKGFSDKLRDELWADPSKMLGRLATIVFMEVSSKGKLRHSVFKNIRWDI